MKKYFFLLFVLLSVKQFVYSQDAIIKNKKIIRAEKKAKKDSIREDKIAKGKIMITPFITPGYTPELGGMLALGSLISFKINKKNTNVQRSSITLNFSYTTTGAIVFNAYPTTYWFNDKLRINGDFNYKDMPDHYWGIGYESAYNNDKSDSTTSYRRNWWKANPRILYQPKKNYLIGLNLDFNYTKGSNAAEMVAEDSLYNLYNHSPYNSGIGFIFRYDSRDIPVNAYSGLLFDFRTTFYSTKFGGDNNYQIFLVDYRQYITFKRIKQVFAWQVKGRFSMGDIPYGEMSQLGTPWDLRGYYWGRYRDKDMAFFLGEYRHTFKKRSGKPSKHGFVLWAAGGKIFNTLKGINKNNKWLPNIGVGYRLEIQPRMNLRLDFGIGRESNGIYFNFNEAF